MVAAVEVRSLSKRYPIGGRLFRRGAAKFTQAVTDVDLTVQAGEVFGVVGRNGYGKTTLIKCIASLLLPTSGNVSVFGRDCATGSRALRTSIGWVGTEERSFYFRLTGLANLRFFARLQGVPEALAEERIRTLAERFGLSELITRRFAEYSTGNRQKLAIVRALLHEPRLLVLDEPTRSLDPFAADALRSALSDWVQRGDGRTIVITSHNLSEIESLSGRVAVMSRGRLGACGPIDELRQRFGAAETIGVRLGEAEPDLPETLASLPERSWLPEPAGGGWLRFHHVPGDGSLPRVLAALTAAGLEPLSVERQVLGLQDIIDRLDDQERV